MKTKEQREIDIKHFNLGYEKGKSEAQKNELELLEFLNDDEKSSEPLPLWAKMEIENRISKLKEAKE